MNWSLQGKVVLVTGATGFLGTHFCRGLSAAGATVAVSDLSAERCEEVAKEINGIALPMDITSERSVEDAHSEIGRVDILINNAGINDKVEDRIGSPSDTSFENYPTEVFDKMLHVNVTGLFLTSRVFGSAMARRGNGSIINLGSNYAALAPDQSLYQTPEGEQLFFKSAAYPTSKSAVLGFTRFLAAYWGHRGVRVNALSPGGVENHQSEFFTAQYCRRTPLGRMATPEDLIGPLIFLGSEAAKYITGQNLVVDGGFSIW